MKNNKLISNLEANLEAYIGLVMLSIYTGMVFWNIVVRSLGHSDLMIADTLSKTLGLFTWLAWLAAAHGVRRESHLRFLMLRNELDQRFQLMTYIIEWVLWILISGLIIRHSVDILQLRMSGGATTGGFPIPTYLFYLAIPVGFTLILFRIGQQIYMKVHKYREGEDIRPDSNI